MLARLRLLYSVELLQIGEVRSSLELVDHLKFRPARLAVLGTTHDDGSVREVVHLVLSALAGCDRSAILLLFLLFLRQGKTV